MASDNATTTPTPVATDGGFGLQMSTIFKALGVVAVIAFVIIAMRAQNEEAAAEAWSAYGNSEREGFTVESLERAYGESAGSAAEPWVAFRLALTLWQSGDPDDLARAEQVASETLASAPDHPAHGALTELLDSIREFRDF